MSSSVKPQTIALVTAGAALTGVLAYALYFDHRRRTDPEFRKALKRETKKQSRIAKEEAEARRAPLRRQIMEIVDQANRDSGPVDQEEKEQYFMQEISKGEALCQHGTDNLEAATCFYRALKLYPQPTELLAIYDKTVPKPVLDILAEMIAYDPKITMKAGSEDHITSVDE